MNFKIGNRVKIRKSSQYYRYGIANMSNPKIVGTIMEMNGYGYLPIKVEWDNTWVNVYSEHDLAHEYSFRRVFKYV